MLLISMVGRRVLASAGYAASYYGEVIMKCFAIVVFVLAVLGIVGNGDMQEAQLAQDEYCKNVASQTWPDYKGNYSEVCK